jgi:hypothetical protein
MKATTTHEKPMVEKPRLDRMQDEYFELVKRLEEPVVRTTARVAPRLAEYVPERPRRMAQLPTVVELVDTGLTFRKRVVDEQARFAKAMLKAMSPMLAKFEGKPTKAAMPKVMPKAAMPKVMPKTAKRPMPRKRTPRPVVRAA